MTSWHDTQRNVYLPERLVDEIDRRASAVGVSRRRLVIEPLEEYHGAVAARMAEERREKLKEVER